MEVEEGVDSPYVRSPVSITEVAEAEVHIAVVAAAKTYSHQHPAVKVREQPQVLQLEEEEVKVSDSLQLYVPRMTHYPLSSKKVELVPAVPGISEAVMAAETIQAKRVHRSAVAAAPQMDVLDVQKDVRALSVLVLPLDEEVDSKVPVKHQLSTSIPLVQRMVEVEELELEEVTVAEQASAALSLL